MPTIVHFDLVADAKIWKITSSVFFPLSSELKYMMPEIPSSLKEEHNELHRNLADLTKLKGDVGKTAKKVADLLHKHFVKEEKYAMPLLGLLKSLADDKYPDNAHPIIQVANQLQEELPDMLSEHRHIIAALDELKDAAAKERNSQAKNFADKLVLHALMEEQVLYPAAVLIGNLLKLKLEYEPEH